jgi:rfaE bifunctional protein nucleotidyltransferase chain/domain
MIINDWKSLRSEIDKLKSKNKKVVFTNGVFDIIHPGHVSYLKESKAQGDVLIVALNSDASVKRLKGESRPVNNLEDRAIVMDALKPVDFVTQFTEDTPFNVISEIIPDIITKGGDYTEDQVVGANIVKENGGEVRIIQFVDGKSTTNIINKMS